MLVDESDLLNFDRLGDAAAFLERDDLFDSCDEISKVPSRMSTHE